ncbi:hypothetical protein BAUCODRAFT_32372 [Baudoinia panamericana UAMH 10762]|uniref:Uncharacterized protein n=1 Tax=Baudoinia panamericana (strain UAMH 10762) TaxID=717646 RepID=M2N306_BAUPA|nr:uncharacterized protein BAUCODRAFT_32372 [Baudoinia panamericana UAMH 10762]EMC98338.1 hypothetical protein BAUCODRAFT_32372 [Baudoinia panamericana UAMH 10762]
MSGQACLCDVSAQCRKTCMREVGKITAAISGRGFLGLSQSGISAHVLSEPSAGSSKDAASRG